MELNILSCIKTVASRKNHLPCLSNLRRFEAFLADGNNRSEALRALCNLAIAYATCSAATTCRSCIAGGERALAYFRFVTMMFLPDEESRRRTRKNLKQVAADVGLPEWLIDLRHQIAHQVSMPGVEDIDFAIITLLEWISQAQNFERIFGQERWGVLDKQIPQKDGEIRELIQRYRSLRQDKGASGKRISRAERSAGDNCRRKIVMAALANGERTVSACICENGFLFPGMYWRKLSLKTEPRLATDEPPDGESTGGLPPCELVDIWEPLLTFTIERCPYLLAMLLDYIIRYKSSGFAQDLAVKWCRLLLDSFGPLIQPADLSALFHNVRIRVTRGEGHLHIFSELLRAFIESNYPGLIGTNCGVRDQPTLASLSRSVASKAKMMAGAWLECPISDTDCCWTLDERFPNAVQKDFGLFNHEHKHPVCDGTDVKEPVQKEVDTGNYHLGPRKRRRNVACGLDELFSQMEEVATDTYRIL